jgi:hypothetical protein
MAFSIFSAFPTQAKASEITLFSDDFESYAIGSRPSPPWEFWFGQDGEIVSSTYVSPTKSLRLLGSWAWSTEAIRRFTSNAALIGYEVYGKAEGFGKPYASLTVAFVKWTSPTTGDVVAGVSFWYDGTIIVAGRKPIGTYEPGKWYKIKVLFDRNQNTYDVWIDDVLKASSIPTGYANPYAIEGFAVMSEWAEVNCYFDDVKVFEGDTTPSVIYFYPPYDADKSGYGGKAFRRIGMAGGSYESSVDPINGYAFAKSSAWVVGGGITGAVAWAWFGGDWLSPKEGYYKVELNWKWSIDALIGTVPIIGAGIDLEANLTIKIVDLTTNTVEAVKNYTIWKKPYWIAPGKHHEEGQTTFAIMLHLEEDHSYRWLGYVVAYAKSSKVSVPPSLPSAGYGNVAINGTLLYTMIQFSG